jgi:CO/xanthine dehydrogenase Mo-binding subunit
MLFDGDRVASRDKEIPPQTVIQMRHAMKDDRKTPGRPVSRRGFVRGAGAFVGAILLVPAIGAPRSRAEQVLGDGESKNRSAVSVRVQFEPGGRVTVAIGSQDLGRSACAIMAETAATTLNLRVELIDVKLDDSTLPDGTLSAGSRNSAGIGLAVHTAAKRAQSKLLSAVAADQGSPLCGSRLRELDFKNCRIVRQGQPESGESFNAFLARNSNQPVAAIASTEPEQYTKQDAIHL